MRILLLLPLLLCGCATTSQQIDGPEKRQVGNPVTGHPGVEHGEPGDALFVGLALWFGATVLNNSVNGR